MRIVMLILMFDSRIAGFITLRVKSQNLLNILTDQEDRKNWMSS